MTKLFPTGSKCFPRRSNFIPEGGMVWCGKGVVYLKSPGRPTDIGYSWAMPAILIAGKVIGEGCFFFVFFLFFVFCLFCFFTFIPVPLSSLFLSFISSTISSISFLRFSLRRHKMTHEGWRVVKPQRRPLFRRSFVCRKANGKSLIQSYLPYKMVKILPTVSIPLENKTMVQTESKDTQGARQSFQGHMKQDNDLNQEWGRILKHRKETRQLFGTSY